MEHMTTKKTPGRPWPKGVSGNPAGRKPGQRHRLTVLAEKLMADDAEAIVRAVITSACNGDMAAARMVLDRIVPPSKERPLHIELPAADTAQGIADAQGAVVEAVACGELLPGEGVTLSNLLERRRQAIETAEHAARIELIERTLKLKQIQK